MRTLFCNIAWLDYYKGIFAGADTPKGGGDYVRKTNDAYEKYNFEKVALEFFDGSFESGDYCLGFVETKASKGVKNQLHIEKIDGCEEYQDRDLVEDVLVIYCANHPAHGFTTVVGWYRHATVYRYYQEIEFPTNDTENSVYVQAYNALAKAKDCVLLPRKERSNKPKWSVPRRKNGTAYGFGQTSVWFAEKEEDNLYLEAFLNRMVQQIDEYEGENWLDKYPEVK